MGRLAKQLAHACLMAGIMLGMSATAQADEPELPADQIEKIVRDYLLREPEIIYEALQELQRRQTEAAAVRQREAIAANQSELLEASHTPVGGNPERRRHAGRVLRLPLRLLPPRRPVDAGPSG